jgi:hypothetical protein
MDGKRMSSNESTAGRSGARNRRTSRRTVKLTALLEFALGAGLYIDAGALWRGFDRATKVMSYA